jgi:hypothetical protein
MLNKKTKFAEAAAAAAASLHRISWWLANPPTTVSVPRRRMPRCHSCLEPLNTRRKITYVEEGHCLIMTAGR